jgi:hypothetical protein
MSQIAGVFGVTEAPALVAIKTGRRTRFAVHLGSAADSSADNDVSIMGGGGGGGGEGITPKIARGFLDSVLGTAGQISFEALGDDLEEALTREVRKIID